MLKKLVTKKHLEFNDIRMLIGSLKKSLNRSLSTILILFLVVFAANCLGVQTFLKDLFSMVIYLLHFVSLHFVGGRKSLLVYF